MGAKEKEIFTDYLRALGPDQRRFRIVPGLFWAGDATRHRDGSVTIRHARQVRTAPEGWPDFCGWDSVTITPDMVGQTLAVFCADEVKSEGDRLSRWQRMLGECLARMGGRWRVIRAASTPRASTEKVPQPQRRQNVSARE